MRLVRARPKLALFLFTFLVYNVDCRSIPAGDSLGTALVPFSLLYSGTVTLDRFVPALCASYGYTGGILHQAADGHYYSNYPILQPILLTPLYLPLRLVPAIGRMRPEMIILLARVIEKLMASLIAAGSVVCFFVLLRRLAPPRSALWLTLIYGFGTSTWATSSQALWQHGASQLTIVASLLCLQRYLDGDRRLRLALGAGLFAALAPAFRPTNLIFFAVSLATLWMFRRRGVLAACYLVAGVLIGAGLADYNLTVFQNLGGGYANSFSGNLWSGLTGLLLSPGRGLFVFAPVLLFSLIGTARWLSMPAARGREIYAIAALFALGALLATALWPVWWGGDCYGPRLLADTLPCLVLLIVPALDWIAARPPARAAFAAAVAFSLMVQVVGVFYYPKGFHTPQDLWNWRECPILLNARAGPATLHYRVLAHWARQLANGETPDWRHSGLNFR
ncbi:MAG TPA: hypothetical protein VG456_06490 [Candidatus Sulfopaludibacter sp.]|jgi:hypothetical protein|nr:hypothetical protein [Candidatus Sulfopaludibacter sp.]